MQRVLDPARIEAFAQRDIPRIRVPDRADVFAKRARRLRQLAGSESRGHGRAIGDYLRLMDVVAEAQQAAVKNLAVPRPSAEEIAQARTHRMPLVHAVGLRRDPCWRGILGQLCDAVLRSPEFPAGVRDTCARLRDSRAQQIEAQADALLTLQSAEIDAAAAPFVMSALQVYWVHLASQFAAADVSQLDVPGVCPVCGTLPVASIVRADKDSQGYRYLHCALCATEWHMVRVTCSQCLATQDISYHSIEGGSDAIRAESCGSCRTYRKILYQEKDTSVEPVADDLASLALDLLLGEAGYHRASGNPLLWQNPPEPV
ncbi:MAG: formate dehydrogenase accessory protein FdhE [Gammaproteobacteria bacterium]|nr:MAG: formate dehydrogenase accessory protein FdhE [Gammaproteobacteria bacterium]